MATLAEVKTGVLSFLDREMIGKISGWKKLVIGAGINLAMDKSENVYNSLKDNVIIQSLELIKDDEIDIETLYKYIYEEIQKEPISVKTALLGTITLTASDVEKLYQCIIKQ